MCCWGSYSLSLSLSRRELCSFLIWLFGVSLSFGDPISVALHARWTPDLTANSPQSQCVTSGTVAGGVQFHIIANFSPPVIGFGVDSVDILEQTDVHEPFHYHSDSAISGDTYSSPPYSVCSSPPTGYQTWVVCNLNVPLMTFSFHNTSYVITANYHYIRANPGAYPPSPSNPMYSRVDGSLSITVKFDNLIVQSEPKILKWDPDNPSNCDTTFSYTLSSSQKKNCQVTIDIYSTEGTKVYETTLTQLCPGTYTFTWDGTANQTSYPPNNIAPTGLYTFDIAVQGACPYDTDKMRSDVVEIQQTSIDIEDDNYKFGYVIDSQIGISPSKVEVNVFGPAADNFKLYCGPLMGGTELGAWNFTDFPQDVVKMGGQPFHTVVSGLDNYVNNKAHKQKPLREAKKRRGPPIAALFYAHYNWNLSGQDQQGNPLFKPQLDQQGYWLGCVEPAMLHLLSGAFVAPPLPPKGFVFFPPCWVAKDDNQLHEALFIPFPVLFSFIPLPGVFFIASPAVNSSDISLALKTVDVFFFAGHGDGYGLEAIQFNEDGSYTQTYFSPHPLSANNFSNLHLAVIGTCRERDAVIKLREFPLVDNLVQCGAKFAIGVEGMGSKVYDEQSKQWKDVNGWYFLYAIPFKEWSKRFWKLAAKGDKDAEKLDDKYPTMESAALKAEEQANIEVLLSLSRQYPTNAQVYIHCAGQDDYLGNIPGTF